MTPYFGIVIYRFGIVIYRFSIFLYYVLFDTEVSIIVVDTDSGRN